MNNRIVRTVIRYSTAVGRKSNGRSHATISAANVGVAVLVKNIAVVIVVVVGIDVRVVGGQGNPRGGVGGSTDGSGVAARDGGGSSAIAS